MLKRLSRADLLAASQEEDLGKGEVYFLYACNQIKIGTSNHPLRRVMREIVPYCPTPLKIIGTIRGGKILENRLHKRFETAWIRDEWFELSAELRTFLCENEKRADRLEDAEDGYRDWLEDEIHKFAQNAD